jgi:APA family basic amino acid/polyamine antiporter
VSVTPTRPELVRTIGRWTLAGLVLNAIVGSSVFGLPAVIAKTLGSASPWAWIFAAVGIGLIVACFAEVASRFGAAGGPYLYARAAFGRLTGIEIGWLAWLVRITASATNANLFIIYLAQFWPAAKDPLITRLILAAMIAPLVALNYRGVAAGARASSVLVVAKLLPLALFLLVGLAYLAAGAAVTPVPVAPAPLGQWLDAVLILGFAYGGFEAALVPMGEARNPQRDAPFALFVALATCATIYTLTQVVVVATLADPGAYERPLAAAGQVLMGPAGAVVMTFGALVSIYGYLAGTMVNVPRITYAMAVAGDLPAGLGAIHPVHRTPHVSLLLYAGAVWLLAASGSFVQNLTLSAVSRLFTYGVICLALPVLRRRERAGDRAVGHPRFRLPGGWLIPAASLAFSVVLATRMTAREAWITCGVLAFGILNWLWARERVPVAEAVA